MSSKRDPDEFDCEEGEVDEEDEGDFFPGIDDDDDEDFDDDELDDENSGNDDAIPPFLQGDLMVDPADTETIIYKQNGSFCLKSQEEIPSTWSLRNPLLPKPINFGGWIRNPTTWIDFQVQISKQYSIDPLDEKLLKAQQESLPISNKNDDDSKFPAKAKSDDPDEKLCKPPPSPTTPFKPDLKAPPSYSLKDPPSYAQQKLPATEPEKKRAKIAYNIIGSQVGTGERIYFRGVFYPAYDGQQNLFLICSVVVDEQPDETTTSTAPAAAASSRKHHRFDDDDDNAGSNGVDYQELIDLHDEAGLSTDELKNRYNLANGLGGKPSIRSKRTKHTGDKDGASGF
jgi:hypothetical protein